MDSEQASQELVQKRLENVKEICMKNSFTVSTAESLTSGSIVSLLTNISGSSNYVKGGVVAYTNETKMTMLGVKETTLSKYTEVSAQTAIEMAHGTRILFNTTYGLSSTGFIEPNAEHDKPMCFIAISSASEHEIYKVTLNNPSEFNRELNKKLIAKMALMLFEQVITKKGEILIV